MGRIARSNAVCERGSPASPQTMSHLKRSSFGCRLRTNGRSGAAARSVRKLCAARLVRISRPGAARMVSGGNRDVGICASMIAPPNVTIAGWKANVRPAESARYWPLVCLYLGTLGVLPSFRLRCTCLFVTLGCRVSNEGHELEEIEFAVRHRPLPTCLERQHHEHLRRGTRISEDR